MIQHTLRDGRVIAAHCTGSFVQHTHNDDGHHTTRARFVGSTGNLQQIPRDALKSNLARRKLESLFA